VWENDIDKARARHVLNLDSDYRFVPASTDHDNDNTAHANPAHAV